ncbi:ecdysteroid-regulated 16 kDa protein [Diachasma alloeum]|uniref:ecdysteroid-regulated 16 kDa protein n=1 Tax=Diachasma alloeum TaxID=454923 RepID=UPI000738510D|nr:ecdysteroid-regulated 16 kDa protein [Diachasma alloeum]
MFGKTALVFTTVLCFVAFGESTDVIECKNGRNLDNIKSITITNCEEPPCELKRGTRVELVQKFVPNEDVDRLTTSVSATILGVRLPFIGVDGSDACQNVYDADGKVGCPLKAGTEYYYKNGFPVLEIYPKVKLVVSWALLGSSNPITCFEIPSKITS